MENGAVTRDEILSRRSNFVVRLFLFCFGLFTCHVNPRAVVTWSVCSSRWCRPRAASETPCVLPCRSSSTPNLPSSVGSQDAGEGPVRCVPSPARPPIIVILFFFVLVPTSPSYYHTENARLVWMHGEGEEILWCTLLLQPVLPLSLSFSFLVPTSPPVLPYGKRGAVLNARERGGNLGVPLLLLSLCPCLISSPNPSSVLSNGKRGRDLKAGGGVGGYEALDVRPFPVASRIILMHMTFSSTAAIHLATMRKAWGWFERLLVLLFLGRGESAADLLPKKPPWMNSGSKKEQRSDHDHVLEKILTIVPSPLRFSVFLWFGINQGFWRRAYPPLG